MEDRPFHGRRFAASINTRPVIFGKSSAVTFIFITKSAFMVIITLLKRIACRSYVYLIYVIKTYIDFVYDVSKLTVTIEGALFKFGIIFRKFAVTIRVWQALRTVISRRWF